MAINTIWAFMQTFRETLTIKTVEPISFFELTEKVKNVVERSGIKNGIAVITTKHTTTAICINEKCEKLQEDMKEFLTKIAPPGKGYKHDHKTIDGRSNAHSHLMALLLRATESIPIVDGKLLLGTWQSVFFIELDGPRTERTVNVMILG